MNLDRQQSGFVLPELRQLARADAGSHARARMSSAHEDAIARAIGTPDFAAASARWENSLRPPWVQRRPEATSRTSDVWHQGVLDHMFGTVRPPRAGFPATG